MDKKSQLEALLAQINESIREHQDIINGLRVEREPIQLEIDRLKRVDAAARLEQANQRNLSLLKEYVRGASIQSMCKAHNKSSVIIVSYIMAAWRKHYKAHLLATWDREGAAGLTQLKNSPPLI
jgi:hypothetical protein